jgi:hypothetical protein
LADDFLAARDFGFSFSMRQILTSLVGAQLAPVVSREQRRSLFVTSGERHLVAGRFVRYDASWPNTALEPTPTAP